MARRETHNATVTRNLDDDTPGAALKGAIFFNAPTLFEGEYPIPALPCFQLASKKAAGGAGIFFVPSVGDEIEIQISVDDGSDDTSDVELDEPRWACEVYSDDEEINAVFKKNYPCRMGWISNKGHHIVFDDKALQLILQSGGGHSLIFDDKLLTAILKSKSGHTLIFNDKTNVVTLEHKDGGKVNITASKIEVIDPGGSNKVILEAGKATIESDVLVQLKAENVELGDTAAFSVTLAENVVALSDLIQVISNVAGFPSSTPIVPMSAKAGTPLDPVSLTILMKGNL